MPLTHRMETDDINIAGNAILVSVKLRVVLSGLKLYVMNCEESTKPQVVVDKLFEYVFLHSDAILHIWLKMRYYTHRQ